MPLRIAHEPLMELLQDFHVLTGIRIVLFDDAFREVLTYPASHGELCGIVREDPIRREICFRSDRSSFEACKQSGRLVVYRCHAGLIEATVPIRANGVIIGYIMFGQITDDRDKENLAEEVLRHFGIAGEEAGAWREAARKVRYRNRSQIAAASKILEACTAYVLQSELVALQQERLVDRITRYVDENLHRRIDARGVAGHFHISRTRLYEIAGKSLGMGLSEFVRMKRMERAKRLLSTTGESIARIAEQVGFEDCTYFSKVFRQEFHLSPREYRAKYPEAEAD